MYESTNGILGETLSGSAYKKIHKIQHDNHIGNRPLLLVPICIWDDATQISTASRLNWNQLVLAHLF